MTNLIDHHGREVAGPDDDDLGYPSWGVFDEHEQMFIKAFVRERDAEEYALTLEVPRLDRWLRYTVARIPADDPLVVES